MFSVGLLKHCREKYAHYYLLVYQWETLKMALGRTLKALRQKQSLNQKALSSLSGVSQATISRIETGRVRQLRSSALKSLADALGVSVDFLMGDPEVFAEIPRSSHGLDSIPGLSGLREERFRQIIDLVDPVGVHENGRILYVNQTMADMLGYRKEELLGQNSFELISAPQSRPFVQRMINSKAVDAYESLLVRKDGTTFPAETRGHHINDDVRLVVMRDTTARRFQQTAMRILQAGMEAESTSELVKVVRILSDEFEDMGMSFEAISMHLIDEGKDLVTSHYALPDARGYRSFGEVVPLLKSIDQHPPMRGLFSHWQRNMFWERGVDEDFANMLANTPLGEAYRPELLIDVPFEQGMLGIGVSKENRVRLNVLTDMLVQMAQPISLVVKHLTQMQSLRDQIENQRRLINA